MFVPNVIFQRDHTKIKHGPKFPMPPLHPGIPKYTTSPVAFRGGGCGSAASGRSSRSSSLPLPFPLCSHFTVRVSSVWAHFPTLRASSQCGAWLAAVTVTGLAFHSFFYSVGLKCPCAWWNRGNSFSLWLGIVGFQSSLDSTQIHTEHIYSLHAVMPEQLSWLKCEHYQSREACPDHWLLSAFYGRTPAPLLHPHSENQEIKASFWPSFLCQFPHHQVLFDSSSKCILNLCMCSPVASP